MNRDEAIKQLKEVYEVDLTEVEPPDTHKIAKIYFGGDATAAALASAAVMAKIFAKPTEGGLALTMEEHAGLQIVYATAAQMDAEMQRKLDFIQRLASDDTLDEILLEWFKEELMDALSAD